MRLTWLPDALRDWGLEVVEHPGWKTRGYAFDRTPRVVVGHHTATPLRARGDFPTLRLLVVGRSDLRGPLSQVGISRTGVAHVLASGKANHAGRGEWRGTTNSGLTVGTEVEHPGLGPWSPALLRAFDRSQAALLQGLGLSWQDYCGHREWALPRGRKVDPGGVDLNRQRDRLRLLLDRGTRPAPPVDLEDDHMLKLIRRDRGEGNPGHGATYLVGPGVWNYIETGEQRDVLVAKTFARPPVDVSDREYDVLREIMLKEGVDQ